MAWHVVWLFFLAKSFTCSKMEDKKTRKKKQVEAWDLLHMLATQPKPGRDSPTVANADKIRPKLQTGLVYVGGKAAAHCDVPVLPFRQTCWKLLWCLWQSSCQWCHSVCSLGGTPCSASHSLRTDKRQRSLRVTSGITLGNLKKQQQVGCKTSELSKVLIVNKYIKLLFCSTGGVFCQHDIKHHPLCHKTLGTVQKLESSAYVSQKHNRTNQTPPFGN